MSILRYNLLCSAAIIMILAGPALAQNEVREGDSPEDVIEALGKPKASFAGKGSVIFMYDRGEVYFEGDRLVKHTLTSEIETRSRLAVEARERAARQAARQRAASDLVEKGKKLKAEKQADPRFIMLSLSKRLAYWKSFRRMYPGVSVEAEIKALEDRLKAGGQEDINAKRVAVARRIDVLEKENEEARLVRGSGVDGARATILMNTKELKELRSIQKKIGLPESGSGATAAATTPVSPFGPETTEPVKEIPDEFVPLSGT